MSKCVMWKTKKGRTEKQMIGIRKKANISKVKKMMMKGTRGMGTNIGMR